jgi:hypothetical protein
MNRVQQPIQFFAAPPDSYIELATKGDHESLDRSERRPRKNPALDPRHRGLRHAAPSGQVFLPPPQPLPERPN